MKVIDLLACPSCGNALTGGEFCNLRCRRMSEATKNRKTGKHERIAKLVIGLKAKAATAGR